MFKCISVCLCLIFTAIGLKAKEMRWHRLKLGKESVKVDWGKLVALFPYYIFIHIDRVQMYSKYYILKKAN